MTSISLTPKESELLTAVINEMTEMPTVDFEVIAKKVGIKYGKNARQGFKRVWEKLKGGSGGSAADDDDGEAPETPKKTTAKPTKKGVGKTTTPRKAAAGGSKTTRKTKKQKEAEAEAEADAPAAAEVAAAPAIKTDAIKTDAIKTVAIKTDAIKTEIDIDNGGQANQSEGGLSQNGINSIHAKNGINGDEPQIHSDEDEHDATVRGISVDVWRAWKLDNSYDTMVAPTPNECLSENEDEA